MKPKRSSESVRVRRELAQLLRRLRAIRKDKLSPDELAERVNVALSEAGSIRCFVTVGTVGESGDHLSRTRVDKRKLSEAGLAPPRIEPVHELEELVP
jgi:hypothetical protein